jgi:hypothetical protein
MAASRYPAVRTAGIYVLSGGTSMSAKGGDEAAKKKDAEQAYDAALALLAESVARDERGEFWEDRWFACLVDLVKGYRQLGMKGPAALEKIDAILAKIPELKALRLQLRGFFWTQYGWESRGTTFAPGVPAGGMAAFKERLGIAKKALDEAWALRPDDARTAHLRFLLEKGIGGGDRKAMETWFERAMRGNGDNRDACWEKLDWLDPKWYGDAGGKEMLSFGRACRDTKNWRTGITLLVADAHWRIAAMPGQNQNRYLASPEVWADIQSVYDEYLEHHPEDDVARSKFATFCHLGGHWREAEVQYVALGDRLTQWTEFPFVPLIQLKQNRARNARIVLGKEGRVAFPGWHFVGGTFDQGEWRVNVPAAAPHREEPGVLGADASHVWNCSADGVTYGIRLLVLPPDLRNEAPDRVLEASRSVVAKERGAQPRNVRDTLLAARHGQEYEVEAPGPKPMQLRVKSIVLGSCLFELSVAASKSDVTSKAANEFFDSFAFQPNAK